jgi:hypothetical protein
MMRRVVGPISHNGLSSSLRAGAPAD